MVPESNNGLVSKLSNRSVDDTVATLEALLKDNGIKLFALIDHSGEAHKVGLTIRPTKLLIFGSPKVGTPVMEAVPTIAIDLPLKVLIWEDGRGKVWVTYNSPEYLQARYGLPPELVKRVAVVETLAHQAAE